MSPAMLGKIKKYPWKDWLKHAQDVRYLGRAAFLVIVLLVTWSSVRVIQLNYELQRRISELQQKNAVRQLENSNLELRNEYFNTDTYLELAARRQFGRAAPGEKLLVVPEEVALAHTVELPSETAAETPEPDSDKPGYQRNFEAWMEFIFRSGGREQL